MHDHDHPHHDHSRDGDNHESLRVLAIDVGAGTQDILLYDSAKSPENCFKMVLPSQTQIVGQRIRDATADGLPIHLSGTLMGGGASSSAVAEHIARGFPVTATQSAARTLHNDPERVRKLGVAITEESPSGATAIDMRDVDLKSLAHGLGTFGIGMPEIVAVAIQDHGYRPGSGNNEVRFQYLQHLVENSGALANMVYQQPPDGMTRMDAVIEAVPGAFVMDTGAAAVLGVLGDPVVAIAVRDEGAVLINVGNMHTFATLVKGRRLYGLFEHHTGGITAAVINDLVERLRAGTIDGATFSRDFDGHGAALDPGYRDEGPFRFVAITGPNRTIARSLGYHEAAPHGDMMLAGSFGLVEGVLMKRAADGHSDCLTLAAG